MFVSRSVSCVPLRIQGTSGKSISLDLQSCCPEMTDLYAMSFSRKHFLLWQCNSGVPLGLDASGYFSELLILWKIGQSPAHRCRDQKSLPVPSSLPRDDLWGGLTSNPDFLDTQGMLHHGASGFPNPSTGTPLHLHCQYAAHAQL